MYTRVISSFLTFGLLSVGLFFQPTISIAKNQSNKKAADKAKKEQKRAEEKRRQEEQKSKEKARKEAEKSKNKNSKKKPLSKKQAEKAKKNHERQERKNAAKRAKAQKQADKKLEKLKKADDKKRAAALKKKDKKKGKAGKGLKKLGKKIKKGGKKIEKGVKKAGKHIKNWSKSLYKKFIAEVKSLTAKLAKKKNGVVKGKVLHYMRKKKSGILNKIKAKLRSKMGKFQQFKKALSSGNKSKASQIKRSVKRPPSPSSGSQVLKSYFQRKIPAVIVATAATHIAMSAVYWAIHCADKGHTGEKHRSCFEENFVKDASSGKWAFEVALAVALLPLENAVFRPICISGTAGIITAASAAVVNPAPAGASPVVYELCIFAFTAATAVGIGEATWKPFLKNVYTPVAKELAKAF